MDGKIHVINVQFMQHWYNNNNNNNTYTNIYCLNLNSLLISKERVDDIRHVGDCYFSIDHDFIILLIHQNVDDKYCLIYQIVINKNRN